MMELFTIRGWLFLLLLALIILGYFLFEILQRLNNLEKNIEVIKMDNASLALLIQRKGTDS